MTERPRLLVLGLGNVLCSDDGAGVAAVHQFLDQYEVPEGVQVLDGGTLGMSLLAVVADADELVLVDAVQAGAPPGSLVVVEGDEVVPVISERLSAHQVGVLDLLSAAQFVECYPKRVIVLGVVPESIELGLARTPRVAASLPALVERVADELRARGFELRRRQCPEEGSRARAARVLGL